MSYDSISEEESEGRMSDDSISEEESGGGMSDDFISSQSSGSGDEQDEDSDYEMDSSSQMEPTHGGKPRSISALRNLRLLHGGPDVVKKAVERWHEALRPLVIHCSTVSHASIVCSALLTASRIQAAMTTA